MTGQPLRIGILGAANIADRAMVEPARDLAGATVVAIGSRDPERAHDLAARLGVPESGDYDFVLSHPGIDLVYVALPPTVQAEWAVRALHAGKHVLCEKPLTANGTTAAQVADAAEASGRRAFVGFHYRMHGFTKRLLDVLGSGTLGDLLSVSFDFSIPHFVVKPGNIRLDGSLGGGAFMDVGCYAVDLIRAAWGDPLVVSATAQLYPADPRVDLQTDAVLSLPGGAPAGIRASFVGDDTGSMSLRVVGTAATLDATSVIVPQWGATLRVVAADDGVSIGPAAATPSPASAAAPTGAVLLDEQAAPAENSYARQLEHLTAALATGAPSPLEASLAVETMNVVDAVYRAAGLTPR